MKKIEPAFAWIVAIIFIQTLFFKFSGASESKWIFSQLGVEPWGRILSGVMELIAAFLLVIPRTRVLGAFLGMGIMGGAIVSHLLILGIVVQNDGGQLFALAVISFVASAIILARRYKELPFMPLAAVIIFVPLNGVAKVSYNDENKFGIQGYDPVSYLIEKKAVEGTKELSTKFDGITYLFSSAANKEKFSKDPVSFIPAYGGWCAYAMAEGDKVDIDPKTFKIIDGKTYLYYNGVWGNTLEKWNKKENVLKPQADKSWEKLIK